MTSNRTNTGDPDRMLALLWRDPSIMSRRGPRQGLTVDRVVSVGTAIADKQGLDALTMRRVAEALGVATTSLYTYVPSKAELLSLMLDAAYAAMDRRETTGLPWRDRLRSVAEENRSLFGAHPWAVSISTHCPSLGPGQMAKYEHELHALDSLGLDDVSRDDALSHLLMFVRAHARAAEDAQRAATGSPLDDRLWWELNEPLLARVLDPGQYPLAVQVRAAVGSRLGSVWNPEHGWTVGLAAAIGGVASLIDQR